jgi:negative regulator of sigma E activity
MNKVIILAMVVLVVVAGVLLMTINSYPDPKNNNSTQELQNTQNLPYSQDSNSYSTSSPSSSGSNSQEVK